jgi:hypothetical protein
MELCEIKQRILNLKDIEFNRFQNWFDKKGCHRINKNAKSSKIRQSVLNLSDKDFIYSGTGTKNYATSDGPRKWKMIR